MVLLENKTRLLLILSQDALDQARVIAGKSTTALKLPVSLQIVLRALIWVGLKRESHPALFANIESQARAVRLRRVGPRRAGEGRYQPSGNLQGLNGNGRQPNAENQHLGREVNVRDDKRRGRGAAPAVIEASSRVQGPSLATVALEGKTYTAGGDRGTRRRHRQ